MEAKKQGQGPRMRRKFTDEFKASAVRLVLEEGRSVTSVAKSLDLGSRRRSPTGSTRRRSSAES